MLSCIYCTLFSYIPFRHYKVPGHHEVGKLSPHTEDCYPGQPHRFKIKPLIKALFRRSVKQTKKEKVSWVNTDKHEANNNREQELILTRLLSLARHLPSNPLTATGEWRLKLLNDSFGSFEPMLQSSWASGRWHSWLFWYSIFYQGI